MANELSMDEVGFFGRNRRRVDNTWELGSAQNRFQKQAAGETYAQNLGSLTRQFTQMREKMPYGFARRGTMNSGLWGRALGEYATNRSTAFGNLATNYNRQQAGFRLTDEQLANVKSESHKDIDNQEAMRIATIAASLRAAGIGS